MKILITSDHAGFELKKFLLTQMAGKKLNIPKAKSVVLECQDLGPDKYIGDDNYPVYAQALAKALQADEEAVGIMICGTGQGSAISLNRFKKVRAAVCVTQKMALLAREHNHANVLCLGARLIGKKKALAITRRFLRSSFQAGRHQQRVELIDQV